MPSAAEVAISTVKEDLHLVFGEANRDKRQKSIERLWVKSEDVVFVDPEKIWKGHEELNDCVDALTKKFPGWVFTELGAYLPTMGVYEVF
jgi:hypothetical protein